MSAMYTKGIGTPGYTAPEVLVGGGGSYNGRLADVFSSGERLFMGNSNATMRRLLALNLVQEVPQIPKDSLTSNQRLQAFKCSLSLSRYKQASL